MSKEQLPNEFSPSTSNLPNPPARYPNFNPWLNMYSNQVMLNQLALNPVASPDLGERIKRPPNAFILYRADKAKILKEELKIPASELSKEIARLWENESEQVKQVYRDRADELRREHLIKYPQAFRSVSKAKKRKLLQRSFSADFGESNLSNSNTSLGSSLSSLGSQQESSKSIGTSSLQHLNQSYEPSPSSITHDAWNELVNIAQWTGLEESHHVDSNWYLPFLEQMNSQERSKFLKAVQRDEMMVKQQSEPFNLLFPSMDLFGENWSGINETPKPQDDSNSK